MPFLGSLLKHRNSGTGGSSSNSISGGGGGVTVTRALQLISSICSLKYNIPKTSCLAD
jgi:hypothetical protein